MACTCEIPLGEGWDDSPQCSQPVSIKELNLFELVFMKKFLRHNIDSNYSEATLWNPTLDPEITERSRTYSEERKARDEAELKLIQAEIKIRIEELCHNRATSAPS